MILKYTPPMFPPIQFQLNIWLVLLHGYWALYLPAHCERDFCILLFFENPQMCFIETEREGDNSIHQSINNASKFTFSKGSVYSVYNTKHWSTQNMFGMPGCIEKSDANYNMLVIRGQFVGVCFNILGKAWSQVARLGVADFSSTKSVLLTGPG